MENKNKIRIVHVLKSSIFSGAENVVIKIIKHLEAEFDFIYIASDGSIRKVLEENQVSHILLEQFDLKGVRAAVNKCDPDIIHAHDFSAAVVCSRLKGNFRLISHLHYNPHWTSRWNVKTLVYAACYPKIDRLLAVSEKSLQEMAFEKMYRSKAIVVGNPLDGDRIRKKAAILLPELEGKKCDLIFVGRFAEEKNPQRFIYLVADLYNNGWSDIRAWMLGEGELQQQCTRIIKELGLQNNIELMGFQKNPYPYIRKSRILCLTSRWEGFGLVAAEANILGVPVLSTDTAGCKEMFGDTAFEICRSDEEFLTKITLLKERYEEYRYWKKITEVRGQQLDNIDSYMKKMADIYRNEG